MIRDLISLQKMLPASPRMDIQDDKVNFSGPAHTISLPLLPAAQITQCIDKCRLQKGRLECMGWAFTATSGQPAKKVFLAQDNHLVAVARPILRIDVRRKLDLVYDEVGYQMETKPEFPAYDGDKVTVLYLLHDGIAAATTKLASDQQSLFAGATKVSVADKHVVFQWDSASNAQSRAKEQLPLSAAFKISIDRAATVHGRGLVAGWAYRTDDHKVRPTICIVQGDRVIVPPSPSAVLRGDVARKLGLSSRSDYFGFHLSFDIGDGAADPGLPFTVIAIDEGKARRVADVRNLTLAPA